MVRELDALVADIAAFCRERGRTVAVVESLTSGAAASALGRGDAAVEWFSGGIVAYRSSTKEALLRLPPGTDPCSPECASVLASSGRELLRADVCVSITGVGGPEPSGGHAAGEVHLGVAVAQGVTTVAHRLDGSPSAVVNAGTVAVLEALLSALDEVADGEPAGAGPGEVGANHHGGNGNADGIRIEPITSQDAGEVLTIQRAAFVGEAQIYGSSDMPPLTQTLEQLRAELEHADGWVARSGTRLVGAMRTRIQTTEAGERVLLIGRIAIAPDMQGSGIGSMLMDAAESHTDASHAELFTGSLSEANLRLYRDRGYVETERIDQGDGTSQVFLRKALRSRPRCP